MTAKPPTSTRAGTATPSRRHRSLAFKLVLVVVTTVSLVGMWTTALVVWMKVRDSQVALERTEVEIRDALEAKGRILSQNHALALRTLVLDNAFSDVSSLVHGAVAEDPDVVYGLFVAADGVAWAYTSPTTPHGDRLADGNEPTELGVVSAANPTKLTVREVDVFDQRIVEFAMPVLEGEDTLGVIRYGLSSARMDQQVAYAQAESSAALRQALVVWTALVGLSGGLGMVVARRFARKITTPLAELTHAATEIAQGRRATRALIRSGDEIEVLADAFNQMVSELDTSNRELAVLNANLEDKVRARTAELASRNREMRLIMDNAQQGFLTVFADGRIAQQRSARLDSLLGTPNEDETYVEFVRRSDPEYARVFSLTLEMIEEEMIPREVCLMQLPPRATVRDKILSFSYVDLSPGEEAEFVGLMVVVEDVTEQLTRERREREQGEALAIYRGIMTDQSDFEAFVAEIGGQIDALCNGELDHDVAQFKRTLHTTKGSLGLYGLELTASICHDLEHDVDERHAVATRSRTRRLAMRWEEIVETANALLGPRDALAVTRADYDHLLASLEAAGMEDDVGRVRKWPLEAVVHQLRRLEDQTRTLAEQLDRGPVRVELEYDDTRLDRATWAPFWQSLAHVVRNAVDHGLLPADELPAAHPPPLFRLSARTDEDRFVVSFADNGRGIDWDAVRQQASARGLPHATHDELVQALFFDGLTTRSRVSAVSGRGVGMSAVKRACERFGGTIFVESALGRGTQVRIEFPRELAEIGREPRLVDDARA